MTTSRLDKVKHLISQMMNDENDEHAQLISEIKKRINITRAHQYDLLHHLSLIHEVKIKLLEEIFEKLKDIK